MIKKCLWAIPVLLTIALFFGGQALADSTEQARVILVDKANNDLLVQRLNGDLWVLQHNPLCGSMSSEFPVTLILANGKVDRLKVDFNEICKVYNAFPYSGEAQLAARILSDNELHPENQAELIWSGKRYQVTYGSGCPDIRGFVGEKIYLSLPAKTLEGGTLELPGNHGQCAVEAVTEIGVDETPPVTVPPKLEGIEHQAQNNQVYFYWKGNQDEKPLYLISYSRYQLNPSLYPWNLMPNLKIAQTNSYTVKQLANKQKYYFYLASLSSENMAGVWTEIEATPVSPGSFKNNPDPEVFEVKMIEKADHFWLTWPAKETARKFRVSLFVNGKPEFSKVVSAATLEYQIPKKAEYAGKGLRFTVRSLSKTPYDPSVFDGAYWMVRP